MTSGPLEPVTTGDPHVPAHNEERDAINLLRQDLGDYIELPIDPKTGTILRFNGTKWIPSTTMWLEGNGNPEGVVAAPVGSRYVDLTAAGGATEYYKKSGSATSNTGWASKEGAADSGFRNITSLIDTRGTATIYRATLRRVGDLVEFYLDIKMPTLTTSPYTVCNLPVGFRPPVDRYGVLSDNKENAANGNLVAASGAVSFYSPINKGAQDRFMGLWTTRDAMPATFPGSAL